MTEKHINEILNRIRKVDVCVYGDFCLDAYWILDPDGSEESVETGVRAEAAKRHYYSPGGASNVVANMAALQPKSIRTIGTVGNDIFGRELKRILDDLGIDTRALIEQDTDYDTMAFCKHYLGLEEQLRVDFGTQNRRSIETERKLISELESAIGECDLVVLNQQVPGSMPNDYFIDEVNRVIKNSADKNILLDSRHYGGRFANVGRKINAVEAAWLCDFNATPRDEIDMSSVIEFGKRIFDRSGKPLFITRGDRGIIAFDSIGHSEIPGIETEGPLDTVGAGDTALSAIALSLAAGADAATAAEIANLAASVTVQKLRRTGTASSEEISDIHRGAIYIHRPELAVDRGQARYLKDANIEIVTKQPHAKIRHALFDHDGTISTLRHGWEEVMEPMMVDSILGDGNHAGETVAKVRKKVEAYIDRSTGIQTILQMEALRQMIVDEGSVDADALLTALEYKEKYNERLMVNVEARLEQIRRGEIKRNRFLIPGAVEFLEELRDLGIKLYLASGTDKGDVVREAEYMGYAELFDGGIYGAVGDIKKYSKRGLLRELIEEHGLRSGELMVIGDGPVEIQECRRHNGVAIGVASDETSGEIWDERKRTRLVRAGAHLIVPDLAESKRIVEYLEIGY